MQDDDDPQLREERERQRAAHPYRLRMKRFGEHAWTIGKIGMLASMPLMLISWRFGLWLALCSAMIGGTGLAESKSVMTVARMDRPGSEALLPFVFVWFAFTMSMLFGGMVYFSLRFIVLGLVLLFAGLFGAIGLLHLVPAVKPREPPKPMPYGDNRHASLQELIDHGLVGPAAPPRRYPGRDDDDDAS